jgi:ArsR family transcriptional regulator
MDCYHPSQRTRRRLGIDRAGSFSEILGNSFDVAGGTGILLTMQMQKDVDGSEEGGALRDLQPGSRNGKRPPGVSTRNVSGVHALITSSALRMKPRADKAAGKRAVTPYKVSPRTLTGLTRVFKQLADESRLKILLALAQEGEMHVSALCQILNQTQPAVSHHLTLLRMTGLVGFRRQGKHHFYRVESGLLCDLLERFFDDIRCGNQAFQFKDFSLAYKRHRR